MSPNNNSLRSMEAESQMRVYLSTYGKSALTKALCRGQTDVGSLLIAQCDVNVADKRGNTALM